MRRNGGVPDWAAIAQLYEVLHQLTGSPVAALNRAVALAPTQGAAAALDALAPLAADERLADYQPYWAARADLLAQIGEVQEAARSYERAIGLERDPAVREFLQQRAARIGAR